MDCEQDEEKLTVITFSPIKIVTQTYPIGKDLSPTGLPIYVWLVIVSFVLLSFRVGNKI